VATEPSGTPPPATPPPGSRVAVIVVPGVGDDARGATVESVSAHLQTRGYRHGERHELLTAQHDEVDEAYSSVWVRLTRGDVPNEDGTDAASSTVDVYEMRWSDLSRFPSKTASFLLGAWGLVLQIPTLALEGLRYVEGDAAVHPRHRGRYAKTAGSAKWLRRALETLSWWLAVPLLLIPASMIGLLAALWLAHNAPATGVAVSGLVLLLIILLGVAFAAGKKLRGGGWGSYAATSITEAASSPTTFVKYVGTHPVYWAVGIVAAVAVCFVSVANGAATLAVAAANTGLLVAAFPLRIVWLLATVLVALNLVLAVVMDLLTRIERHPYGRRARRTAVAALAVAPLGLAIVNSVALGIIATILLKFSRSNAWSEKEAADLECLADSRDWTPQLCNSVQGSDATDGLEEWGRQLFEQILAPTVVVAIVLGVVLLFVVGFFLSYGFDLGIGRRPEEQGPALRSGLLRLGRYGPWLLAAALVVSIVGVWVAWVGPGSLASWLSDQVGAGDAWAVAAVLAIAAAIGTSFLPGRGPIKALWTAMDTVYDIATYRRISHHGVIAPRERMFARYVKLLQYIYEGRDGEKYDRIVILAHSQGCLVTVGAIFGEPVWERSALELGKTDGKGRQTWTPPPISLLTCGNPISQLYRAMLPGSYDWVSDRTARGGSRPWPVEEWVNLYRAGDYVGRSLWSLDQLQDPDFWQSGKAHQRVERREIGWQSLTTATGTENPTADERCIGAGMHTGYWSEEAILSELRRMIDGRPPAPGPTDGAKA
jgi:hypothetical protein